MLEVSNIKVHVAPLRKHPAKESKVGFDALLRTLRVSADDIASYELHKRSIDARKRNDIVLILTYHVNLKGGPAAEQKLLSKIQGKPASKHIKLAEPNTFTLPKATQPAPPENRPVVVGAGCAGLFCALTLAKAGLNPLLIERGDDATRRTAAVEHHNQTGQLDLESNIQFGLGGAGTFSDGKLNTGTKSASHRFILETFVKAGAQKNILWDAKPHVGSDVLPAVVTNIVAMIEDAGGSVAFRTKLTSLERASDGSLSALQVEKTNPDGSTQTETIKTHTMILATGHSSRDTYVMLKDKGISMERKTFAMGVRIEHLQSQINKSLYGPEATNPVLGAAPYKLSVHLPSGRSAFSFCMCPGGYVVSAASEKNGVVTNGMSLSDRAGKNANSGLLANVYPEDLPGDDVLAGIELQRTCEQAAYKAGGGAYVAPAQLVGDFLNNKASTGPRSVKPTYPRGVTWTSLEDCLPPYILQTLQEALPVMDKKLHGFAHPDAVLTGVETRSSSPVRITRDETGQSVNTPGIWPVGEGAGYAGGIMSAAADGIRMAELIVERYNNA